MDVARRGEDGGFVDDVAGVIASTARRRPITSAVVAAALPTALLSTMDERSAALVPCVIAGAYFSGAATAGPRSDASPTPRIRWCDILGVATAILVGELLLLGEPSDGAPFTVALFGLAYLIGTESRSLVAAACAAFFAWTAFSPTIRAVISHAPLGDEAGATLLWTAVVALIATTRRSRRTAAVVAATVMGTFVWRESRPWGFWHCQDPVEQDVAGSVASFVDAALATGASVLAPVLVGRAGAAMDSGAPDDAVDRFTDGVRRRPWRVALAVLLVGAVSLLRLMHGASHGHVLILIAGLTFLGCAASSRRGAPASFAPWAVGAALCPALAYSACAARLTWPGAHIIDFDGETKSSAVVLGAPLLVGLVATRRRGRGFPWWGWAATACVVAAWVANRDGNVWDRIDWIVASRELAWASLASLLLFAVATSDVSALVVVALSPLVSFVLIDGFYLVRAYNPMETHIHGPEIVTSFVAGPVAALLALAARRVRSPAEPPPDLAPLAAVPAHPGFPEAPRPL